MSADAFKRERLRRGLDWIELNLNIAKVPRHPEFPVSHWRVTADLPDFGDDDDGGEATMDTIFTMNGWLFPVDDLGGGLAEALDAIDADSEV